MYVFHNLICLQHNQINQVCQSSTKLKSLEFILLTEVNKNVIFLGNEFAFF